MEHYCNALLIILVSLLHPIATFDITEGGILRDDYVLDRAGSPYTIKNDLFVDQGVVLTVEAGVEVRFYPGVMLAVNGTLIAQGSADRKIKFTKSDGVDGVPQWPSDIRLVDEASVHLGRLQLLYKGKWRGVCSNFQNWTQEDTDVACRQLGFKNGTFSFLSYSTNDSLYLLYHQPDCSGQEASIWDCARANTIQIGSRICLHQNTIHLQCEGMSASNPASNHWWGLEFYNSTVRTSIEGTIVINESASVLNYVDILYAGKDKAGKPAPAVRASPYGPHLLNVNVMHSALDGVNFTEIKTHTIVHRSNFINNRGHGINVESHFGRVSITNSRSEGNYGNGMKTKFIDGKYPIFNERDTFCQRVDVSGNQRFPQMMVGIPSKGLPGPCTKKFQTMIGHVITFNILEMETEIDAKGWIDVYDGRDKWSQKIGHFPITNGTLPQGLTSTYNYMYLEFNWETLPYECPLLWDCMKFTIMMDSGPNSVPELYVNNSVSVHNNQHGFYLENVRNYASLGHSNFSYNGYGAGLRVFGGAGDVHVNASKLTYNQDNAINITYGGGWRIFNMSDFTNNIGNGINITINETRVDNKTRWAKHQRTEVFRSQINYNEGMGVRVGNFCQKGIIAINDSFFTENRGDAIQLESCFQILPQQNITNFTVAYNQFHNNYGHAIRIVPLINAEGRITNNTFTGHPRHVLLLDNTDDFLRSRDFTLTRVDYSVMGNTFKNNKGFYVAHVRLTEKSALQKMDFKFNIFRDNEIEGGFPTLNSRTKANAVLIVSSTNINCSRNEMNNPNSKFELATHLQDPSATLQSSQQYWGLRNNEVDYNIIIAKIFDHFSRFNLAKMEYHPVLQDDWLYAPSEQLTWTKRAIEIPFMRGEYIGGRLYERKTLEARKRYYVDRDINVLPEGKLTFSPGTILEFDNSVGIFSQGEIQTDISNPSEEGVVLTLRNSSTYVNNSRVRLADGPNEMEGRLEVRPTEDDEWGTVCDVGWSITDASVVCQQLGFVIHPDDWRVKANLPGSSAQPIWRSYVRCTELDMDVMECAADSHMDHSCLHDDDVYVRCKPPTWAGIQILASATSSRLYQMTVEKAGLLDPTALLYSPAITIDYNVHTLERLTVQDNVATGIEIFINDVYANAKVAHSIVRNNFGNGITSRSSFFDVAFCTLEGNSKAGFEYNPQVTTVEALNIRRSIHDAWYLEKMNGNSQLIPNQGYKFLLTSEFITSSEQLYEVEFYVNSGYFIVVDVFDWNPDVDQEKITIFDGGRGDLTNRMRWTIEEDLVDFPIQSGSTKMTFQWKVSSVSSGRLAFALRSKPWDWRWPFPTIKMINCTSEGNERGAVTRHYNQPSNEFLDLFFRHRWETITITGTVFKKNSLEGLHVPSITKYNELYMPTFEELQTPHKIAEINYEINSCHFTQNGGGVLGEHNHVEFSNNVWIWELTHNVFDYNTNGGFSIELPKVNLMYQELYNHSVDVNDTIFEFNENFEFRVDGFYCNSSIYRNRWFKNTCKLGCITISGTEKDLEIHDNEIIENSGRYIMELYMSSHTPYTRWVDGRIMYNNFKRNTKPGGVKGEPTPTSSPKSYTVGIKGLQNITINRNLFSNGMDYEMVGGQVSSALENYLDVTENYWGSYDQITIRSKIFDFDDWNNYAIAEYYPFLLGDSFDAPLDTGGKHTPEWDPSKPLGGRIEESMTLYKRTQPYIVSRDITVMPQASLLIEEGVQLQFYPNVGILVLGSLSVRGKGTNRVKFGPIPRNEMQIVKVKEYNTTIGNLQTTTAAPSRPGRRRRQTTPGTEAMSDNIQVRLHGGERENEGFVEFYNATERRWAIICDESFNDRTAEVACRSMGLEASNVYITRTRYYDMFVLGYPKMHEQVIEWFWRRTMICDGTEDTLDQCRYKQNYHLYRCMEERDYVFLRCGERNLAEEFDYWGNIRFSTPEYEHGDITPGYSNVEHADIYGAGVLHGEKSAAIQSVHRVPTTDYVKISNCAWNAYDYIAPRDEFRVSFNELHNNNGYGVGGLVLNGDSNYNNMLSSFHPLVENTVPYNTYGLVRMCTTEKLIYVKDRLLLYYKYRFETIDCIKIIRSKEPRKQVAVRFLQVNLYNDTFYKNAVEMYNGEYFDPELLIGEITPNSTEDEKRSKFATGRIDQGLYYDTMGIRVTASPAHGEWGFIAEVVTLPLSPGWKPDLGPGFRQHIRDTAITGNQRGAFFFQNAGELNPSVIIERCRIQDGGIGIYNLTSPHVMSLTVQNSRLLTISNNYIVNNAGGIFVNTSTNSLATAIYANITNNVMIYNTHGELLHIEGHHYQGINVRNNYMAHNQLDYNNVVALFGTALNFTTTNIMNCTGQTIINASVPSQVAISQQFYGNGFYDNYAIGNNHTTIFLYSAKTSFRDNYFLNRFNFYELVTYNRTKYDDGQFPNVKAEWNWWGMGTAAFISGRIWDRRDDDELIRVSYEPFHETNSTLLQGRCYPGWRLYNKRCYLYMGGVTPYHEAQIMCKKDRSTLARALDTGPSREYERFLGEVVQASQENYDVHWRVWVYSENQKEGLCPTLKDYKIDHADCNTLLPFMCERAPYVEPEMNWWPVIIALSVTGAVLFIVFILIGCACCKNKQRKEERFKRRDSLRASLHASKASIMTTNTHLAPEVIQQKRRRPPLSRPDDSNGFMDLSGATLGESNTDSFDKQKLDFHRPITPASTLDYNKKKLEDSSLYSSDTGPRRQRYDSYDDEEADTFPHSHPMDNFESGYKKPRPGLQPNRGLRPPNQPYGPHHVENEIPNISQSNLFQNAYKNPYFDDMASVRSRLQSSESELSQSIMSGAAPYKLSKPIKPPYRVPPPTQSSLHQHTLQDPYRPPALAQARGDSPQGSSADLGPRTPPKVSSGYQLPQPIGTSTPPKGAAGGYQLPQPQRPTNHPKPRPPLQMHTHDRSFGSGSSQTEEKPKPKETAM